MVTRLLAAAAMALVLCITPAVAATLDLLTWKGYAPASLVENFERMTGITVRVSYSNNEEMIVKLRATGGAGFDLAQPSQDRIASVQKKYGIYRPIDLSRVGRAQISAAMLSTVQKNTTVDGKPYAVPFCWGTSGLVVNRKLAPEASDYTDLVNPAYCGRISYRLKRPVLIALAFALGEDPFARYGNAAAYKALMEEVGEKLVLGKRLVRTYWNDETAILTAMRTGEVAVAMAWDNSGWKLHQENPDIDFIVPKSGALGWIDTFALPAKAQNIEAAYRWINFMLAPENAAIFMNAERYGTASEGATQLADEAVQADFERSFSKADFDHIRWYPPVSEKLEAIEVMVLDKIKAANRLAGPSPRSSRLSQP